MKMPHLRFLSLYLASRFRNRRYSTITAACKREVYKVQKLLGLLEGDELNSLVTTRNTEAFRHQLIR